MLHNMSMPSPSSMPLQEINQQRNFSSNNGVSNSSDTAGAQIPVAAAGKLDVRVHVSTPDLKKQLPRCNLDLLDFEHESNMKGPGHMCRYCKRHFTSGRALGGHMRSHAVQSAAASENSTRPLPSSDSHMQSSAWDRSDFHGSGCAASTRNMEGLAMTEEGGAMSAGESSSSEANNDTKELPDNKVEGPLHPLYALRCNPKRSKLFREEEFAFDSAVRRASSSSTERSRTCMQCGKEFLSSKSLSGHMRCHSEREWKGNQHPEISGMQDEEDSSVGVAEQKRQCLIYDLVAHKSGHELEFNLENKEFGEPEISYKRIDADGMPMKMNGSIFEDFVDEEASNKREEAEVSISRHRVSNSTRVSQEAKERTFNRKVGQHSDSVSDLGSIQKGHTSAWNENHFHPLVTGKRSRRSRHTWKPLGILEYQEPEHDAVTTPTEIKEERDLADCLVMLAYAGRSLEETARIQRQLTEESAFSDSARNQMVETDYDSEEQETTWIGKSSKSIQRCRKDRRVDESSVCEDGVKMGQVNDERLKQAGDNLNKYECNKCKRVFNSHQALGGHRASHRRVKGCFAKTNFGEESHECVGKDITNDEYCKLEDDLEKGSCSVYDQEGERSNNLQWNDGQQTMTGTTSARKLKGHECSICHRVFTSGQALGGHKRSHWTGEKVTEATSIASKHIQVSSINGAPNRVLKEDFLDLNLPAPLDDDDMEAAYGMTEVVQVYSRLLDTKGAEETLQHPRFTEVDRKHNTTAGGDCGTEDMHLRIPMTVTVDRRLQNNTELGESIELGTSSQAQLNLSSRFVHCNICDIVFNSLEAFGNHQKTHSSLVSSVAGVTPISA